MSSEPTRPRLAHTTAHRTDGDGNEWRLDLFWRDINGRREVVELRVRSTDYGEPISTSVLRGLNVGSLIDEERVEWGKLLHKLAQRSKTHASEWGRLADAHATPGRSKGGRPPMDDAEVREVARVYLEAADAGEPVVAAVSRAFHVSTGGANKRIARARKLGYLPPSGRQGKGKRA